MDGPQLYKSGGSHERSAQRGIKDHRGIARGPRVGHVVCCFLALKDQPKLAIPPNRRMADHSTATLAPYLSKDRQVADR
jgi:hypothetical protein